MDRLKGKVAIITGAAKGLGEADARLFAQEGAQVILTDVDVANGERIAREIGSQATFMRLDVRHESEWQQLINDVMARCGRLDVLVNNAGVAEFHTPETITAESYRLVMEVSIDGTVFGCKHAIPAMKASGGGSIINMASVASVTGEPYVAGYCAAKGAVESYTRAVAVYCAQNQLNIRCNSVHPGGIDTPMVQSMPGKAAIAGFADYIASARGAALNPLGRPVDIANLVLYLASDESRFFSGQKLVIDNTATVTMGAVPGGGSVADRLAQG
jgi:3(or 17)beta-hydroxysteroid dehydrogenase